MDSIAFLKKDEMETNCKYEAQYTSEYDGPRYSVVARLVGWIDDDSFKAKIVSTDIPDANPGDFIELNLGGPDHTYGWVKVLEKAQTKRSGCTTPKDVLMRQGCTCPYCQAELALERNNRHQ
jgi:hypothetical protein